MFDLSLCPLWRLRRPSSRTCQASRWTRSRSRARSYVFRGAAWRPRSPARAAAAPRGGCTVATGGGCLTRRSAVGRCLSRCGCGAFLQQSWLREEDLRRAATAPGRAVWQAYRAGGPAAGLCRPGVGRPGGCPADHRARCSGQPDDLAQGCAPDPGPDRAHPVGAGRGRLRDPPRPSLRHDPAGHGNPPADRRAARSRRGNLRRLAARPPGRADDLPRPRQQLRRRRPPCPARRTPGRGQVASAA